MPRLLLVDDNPSIHRIAESLLAPTDVELVCVDSAAEALDRIGKGERFDVALVDTAMPGMDGWALLERLRALEATARLPIALMAGVLDPVDPAKLAKAPVQGFLKKPIELRELGDRVKALLATPVAAPAPDISLFATVPATPARELARLAEAPLPEFRPEPQPMPEFRAEPMQEPAPAPAAATEDDLLVLTADDLWPEEAPAPLAAAVEAAAAPTVPEVNLELEELDFDSLQDLSAPPDLTAAEFPEPAVATEAAPEPAAELEPELEPFNPDLADLADLALLEPAPESIAQAPTAEPEPEAEAEVEEPAALSLDGLEPLLPAPAPALAAEVVPQPAPEPAPEPMPEPAPALAPTGQLHAAPGQVPADQAQAVIQALLADPVLVDALVKAVVARMGDQVVREIAWEVMPELAGRLQR